MRVNEKFIGRVQHCVQACLYSDTVLVRREHPSMHGDELDDLEDVARAASSSVAPVVAPQGVAVGAAVVPFPGGADAAPCPIGDGELADLQFVVQHANRRIVRRFTGNSWEHAKHARTCRAEKKALEMAAKATHKKDKLERVVALVREMDPKSVAMVARKTTMPLSDEDRAVARCQLAVAPTRHGAHQRAASVAQVRAAYRVVIALEQVQKKAWDAMASPPGLDKESAGYRITTYSHQFDESLQKARKFSRRPGLRQARAKVKVQVMLQFAKIAVFCWSVGSLLATTARGPWLCRALFLWRQTRDFILEGILRCMPFDVEDLVALRHLGAVNDAMLLLFSRDGADANDGALQWLFGWIFLRGPKNILPFSHWCVLHKVALARFRSAHVKLRAAAFQSLGRWLRTMRNLEALVNSAEHVVRRFFRRRCCKRPQEYVDRADELVKQLYCKGLGGDAHLYKKPMKRGQRAGGQREPTAFYEALLAFLQVVDLPLEGDDDEMSPNRWLTHWCNVEQGSDEDVIFGMRVGSPCCRDDEEAVEKKTVASIQNFVSYDWSELVVSRWVKASTSLKRGLVSSLGPGRGLLPEILDDVQVTFDVGPALEAQLARVVQANRDDFAAGNKLRLVRLCKVFCEKGVREALSLTVCSTEAMDDLMYHLLPREKVQCKVLDLMVPLTSPVTRAQVHIWAMLSAFHPRPPSWLPAGLMRVDFSDESLRLAARAQLLQQSAGLFEYVELRLSKPPYTTCMLAMDELPAPIENFVVGQFFEEPEQCLPLGCMRLKEMCPTRAALRAQGPQIFKAFNSELFVNIDMSERGHATMRVEMQSQGPGRSPTCCANRVVCRQASSEHLSLGGIDASAAPLQVLDDEPTQGSGVGGSAWMEHRNMKRRAWKAMVAPDRPLTEDEYKQGELAADREWQSIDSDHLSREEWKRVLAANRSARAASRGPSSISDGRAFHGLWGQSKNKSEIVNAAELVLCGVARKTSRAEMKIAWQDERLNVREAPARCGGCVEGWSGKVDGCDSEKKNICRDHLGVVQGVQVAMVDGLAKALSASIWQSYR